MTSALINVALPRLNCPTQEAARRALDDLGFLFASEQQKLSRQLAAERDRFLAAAEHSAESEDDAQETARAAVDEWLQEIEPEAGRLFASASARFSALLRYLGASEEIESHLVRRCFYFTALPELTGRAWLRGLSAREYLRRLLETNSARVINDLIDLVVESRRGVEREVAASLREVLAAAERAAERARRTQDSGRERASEDLTQLDALAAQLEGFR